ncbi:MAG: hypothetical protein L6R42_008579 [Xanthoria sp. 1 TBL-2021]|nr:MAG: hypothetical protein L6R42_008579 [Xanthoria sp. 1 TBL-2021]
MLRPLVIALFTLLSTSLPTTTASPAAAAAQAVSEGLKPQWNTPLLFRPAALNTTAPNGQSYVIPESNLIIIVNRGKKLLGVEDTVLLLLESLFSATQRLHEGGKTASDPVEIFTHKHGFVQMQVIGMLDMLTPFKAAQVFAAMARIGERVGYFEASMVVVQHGVGPIAQIHIV